MAFTKKLYPTQSTIFSYSTVNTFTIHPRIVAYNSKANKIQRIATQQTAEGKGNYEACDRAQAVKTSVKATGSLFWLSGTLFKVVEGAQELEDR